MAKHSATPATAFLAERGVAYTERVYDYVEHGGTSVSSSSLGVPEHEVVKTLLMETDKGEPLVVLMHGDRKVSTKELARAAGAKRVFPCRPEDATRHSGYLVGGCSPFGTRKRMPVYMERTILDLPHIYINGGRRGYLLRMAPSEVARVLSPVLVDVGREE
jgi:Cys-tRNA(Pro) deacylase